MRKRPPIDVKQLHRTTVRLRGATLRRASVLPFFDREGLVHAAMILWPGSPEILVIRHTPELMKISWRGYVDLVAGAADLENARGAVLESVLHLWHWDPWWELDRKPWRHHAAVEALKRTNCVDKFDLPIRGAFTDLALTTVFFEAKGGGDPRLPESPAEPRPAEPAPSREEVVEPHPEDPHAPAAPARAKKGKVTARAERPVPAAPPAAPANVPPGRRRSRDGEGGWRLRPVWETDWPPRIRNSR